MEQYGGPAALGGVITGLMLGAWLLGRWQSVPGAAADATAASRAAAPSQRPAQEALGATDADHAGRHCQAAARAERRAVLENAAALAQLHEDVSAYRNAQQVLCDVRSRELLVGWSASGEGQPCRYLGVSGQPTCPMPAAATTMLWTCGTCSALRHRGAAAVAAQPSPEPVAFARV